MRRWGSVGDAAEVDIGDVGIAAGTAVHFRTVGYNLAGRCLDMDLGMHVVGRDGGSGLNYRGVVVRRRRQTNILVGPY